MRKSYFIYAVLICCLTFAAGCTEDGPQNKPANTPDALNSEIVIAGNLIYVGRPVTVSIEVPALSEDVEKAEYSFYLKEDILNFKEVTPENGKCSANWTAPEAREYVLVFSVEYTFTKPDANGNFTRMDEVEKTVTVLPCNVRNSNWGDTLNDVKSYCGGELIAYDGIGDSWGAELANSYGNGFLNSAKTEVIYTFIDGRLSFASERNLYNYDEFNPFTLFINYCRLIEADYQLLSIEWYPVSEAAKNAAQGHYNTFKNQDASSDQKIKAREELDVLFRYGSIAPAFTYKSGITQLIIKGSPYDESQFEIRRQYGSR